MVLTGALSAAAQAANFTATNGNYPLAVSGGQTTEFKFTAGIRTITCKTVTFSGTASAASSSQILTGNSSECSATGGLPATETQTVTKKKCVKVKVLGGGVATVDVCEEEHKHIYASAAAHSEGKAPVCTVTIPKQEGLTGVTLTNEGSGTSSKIRAEFNIKPAVSISGSALVCGTGTTGTYTGTVVLGGASEGFDFG